ncbi:MAG: spore coat protein [Bacillota bacterium]
MNLTQKEKTLLKDQKSHEKICIDKYTNYAEQAQDSELEDLFNNYASQEKEHLNTINQILNGNVPQMGGQQSQSQNQTQMNQSQNQNQSRAQNKTQNQGHYQARRKFQGQAQSRNQNQNTGQHRTQTRERQFSQQNNQQTMRNQNSQGNRNQNNQAGMSHQKDAKLCNDLLMTEKYVSGTYDTAIFECTDSNVRNALNHIQKEEQQHGEGIFNYMQSKGMYNPQQ